MKAMMKDRGAKIEERGMVRRSRSGWRNRGSRGAEIEDRGSVIACTPFATVPLINRLSRDSITQIWCADDAAAVGKCLICVNGGKY